MGRISDTYEYICNAIKTGADRFSFGVRLSPNLQQYRCEIVLRTASTQSVWNWVVRSITIKATHSSRLFTPSNISRTMTRPYEYRDRVEWKGRGEFRTRGKSSSFHLLNQHSAMALKGKQKWDWISNSAQKKTRAKKKTEWHPAQNRERVSCACAEK